MPYALLKNNKIEGWVLDEYIEEAKSAGYETSYVSITTELKVGDSLECYDSEWHRYPEIDLVKTGKIDMPKLKKFNNEKTALIDKSWEDLVLCGIEDLPITYKIENGKLLKKQNQELLEEGIVTQDDIYRKEIKDIERWFESVSYISEKIAEGRATVEEYADIIEIKNQKAQRLNELRSMLGVQSDIELFRKGLQS